MLVVHVDGDGGAEAEAKWAELSLELGLDEAKA